MIIEVHSTYIKDLLDRERAFPETIRRVGNSKLLLLRELENYTDEERAVSQAISLDIRGEYGYFLNPQNVIISADNESLIEWYGNLFYIVVNYTKKKTYLQYLASNKEEDLHRILEMSLKEWEDALLSWKSEYLHSLGFLEFESNALSHFFGILIMSKNIFAGNDLRPNEIRDAIGQCADRYGVTRRHLYEDCKKATGLHDTQDVFSWIIDLFHRKPRKYDEYVMDHIYKLDRRFTEAAYEYLDIEL